MSLWWAPKKAAEASLWGRGESPLLKPLRAAERDHSPSWKSSRRQVLSPGSWSSLLAGAAVPRVGFFFFLGVGLSYRWRSVKAEALLGPSAALPGCCGMRSRSAEHKGIPLGFGWAFLPRFLRVFLPGSYSTAALEGERLEDCQACVCACFVSPCGRSCIGLPTLFNNL